MFVPETSDIYSGDSWFNQPFQASCRNFSSNKATTSSLHTFAKALQTNNRINPPCIIGSALSVTKYDVNIIQANVVRIFWAVLPLYNRDVWAAP